MFIAEKLRKQNIAEYLLYMWQVEDIIRANGCDMETLRKNYLSRFTLPDPSRKEEFELWYANQVRMMREEGVEKKGHLQINKGVISLLTDLHLQLLNSGKFPFYHAAYFKILPFIVEVRAKGDDKNVPELENCFDILYGVMVLRLRHKDISKDTELAVADITKFLRMLSDFYLKDKAGELDI